MAACNIKLCLPSYRVCSNHFTNDQYELNGYLKKEAVPMNYKLDVLMSFKEELHSPAPTSIRYTYIFNLIRILLYNNYKHLNCV